MNPQPQKRKEIKSIKQYLTFRNILIAAILFILYLMFSSYVLAVVIMVIIFPISILSIKTSKIVPNMNVEIVTAFSFFLAYFFGMPVGIFYGVILGAYMWSTAFAVNQFIMLNVVLNGLCAFLGQYFHTAGWEFYVGFQIAMIARNVLTFAIGPLIGGSPVENTMHAVTDALWSMIVLAPILSIFAGIMAFIMKMKLF
jgi:hypothetical protein